MSFEQESTATETTTHPWHSPANGEPPPPPTGGSPAHFARGDDGDGPDAEAAAQRGALFAHWAADDAVEPGKVVDKLEAQIAAMPAGDVVARLEQLDAIGAQHKAQAADEIQQQDQKLDQAHDEQKAQLPEQASAGKGPAAVLAPPSRAELSAAVEARTAAELVELDDRFAKQKESLEEKLAKQLASLDDEHRLQDQKIAGRLTAGSRSTEADIQRRKGEHDRQIAAESKTLDAEVTKADKPIAEQGKQAEQQAESEAWRQAEETGRNANLRAEEIRNLKTDATSARETGESKAKQAIAAAEARALDPRVPDDEKAKIRDDGQQRAAAARAEGERNAKAIEAKAAAKVDAKADADKLLAQGDKDARAQLDRGRQSVERAAQQARGGEARVAYMGEAGKFDLQARSAEAVARMEAERKTMNDTGATAIDAASGDMDHEYDLGRREKETAKAEALKKMQTIYDQTKKRINEQKAAHLARIAKAKTSELGSLKKLVERDMRDIGSAAEDAERKLQGQVKTSSNALATLLVPHKAKIRARGAAAIAAIDTLIRNAKQGIARGDKDTRGAIAKAAKAGREAVAREGDQAVKDIERTNAEDLAVTKAAAVADRAKLDADAKEMDHSAAGVDAKIDEQWVAAALKDAGGNLDDKGRSRVVTEGESIRAMNLINGLPPELQGKAIAGLDKDQFHHLLRDVPKVRREEFESLVANTHDPEKKLLLWAEYHKSHAESEARKAREPEGGSPATRTPTEKLNKERNDHRAAAALETDVEVADEVRYLQWKQSQGQPLTEADVEDLQLRKWAELQVEMKHGVNFTNQRGLRPNAPRTSANYDGSKIVWSAAELYDVDKTLSTMSREMVGGHVKEMRREFQHPNGAGVGGSHLAGTVRVYDSGSMEKSQVERGGFRFDGLPREYTPTGFTGGGDITREDAVLIHELGHAAHNSPENTAAFAEYRTAAGWDTQSKADDDAMPNTEDWSYARTDPKDQFAEHFALAHLRPATLFKDLCFDPQQKLDAAAANPNTPPATLAKLRATRDKRKLEYDIMRNKVLHADEAQRAAEARIDPARREAFLYEAAQLSTPEQIEQLAQKYTP